jgi:glycosyltransferase involved in cell wall biosynthesis
LTVRKILYVFTGGRKVRLAEAQAGREAPLDFLFGVTHLQKKGYDVDVLELTELSPDEHSRDYKELADRNARMQRVTGFTSGSHLFVGAVDRLNQYDAVVAAGDSVALGLSHFIQQGTLRPPTFMLAMGMLLHSEQDVWADGVSGWGRHLLSDAYYGLVRGRHRQRRRVYRELLGSIRAGLYFERSEYDIARRLHPDLVSKMRVATACIDTDFWRPRFASPGPPGPILFMGNDRQRDFDLALQIASRLSRYRFVFVTKKIEKERIPSNVTLIQGDWKTSPLSDLEVRDIFWDSAVVILPFKAGALRSLTSVALQAMACGKPVVVTKTAGFWDPAFVDGEHVCFIRSSAPEEWCRVVGTLMDDQTARDRIGARARSLVERENNMSVLGANIERLLASA